MERNIELASRNRESRGPSMLILERFRAILRAKNLSADEVGRRAGIELSYICGIESGQIVPPVPVWERIAVALEVPLAKLFYDGEGFPNLPNLPRRKTADDIAGVRQRIKKSRTQPLSKSDNQSK